MEPTTRQLTGVRVLHKTLNALESIKESPNGLILAELARSVQLPKATVYRIVNTLEGRGYLDRGKNGSYRLAKKLFEMQSSAPIEQILARAAEPIISALVAHCKETVNLGILNAGEVVVIRTVESPQSVRMSSKVGNRRHLHATALGKVLLAGMPDKEILRLVRLKGLPRLTANTLVTKPDLLAELRKVRQQGFAIDNQENEIEGRCIGAPIIAPDGSVAAALSISAPVFRMDMARTLSLAPKLNEACATISRTIHAYCAES